MCQSYVLPEDVSTTNEQIWNEIMKYGDREWRSEKNLKEYLLENNFNKWRVVGWASSNTLKKWHNLPRDDMWIIAKGLEWKYVYSLGRV